MSKNETTLPEWGCYDYTQPNGEDGVFSADQTQAALDNAANGLVEKIQAEQGVSDALKKIRLIQRAYTENGADDTEGRESLWAWLEKVCEGTIYSAQGLWDKVEDYLYPDTVREIDAAFAVQESRFRTDKI